MTVAKLIVDSSAAEGIECNQPQGRENHNVYTDVLNRGGKGVRSPVDTL